jgi:putative hemolysin
MEISLLSTTAAKIKSSNFSNVFKTPVLKIKKDLKVFLILVLIFELIFDYWFSISFERIIESFAFHDFSAILFYICFFTVKIFIFMTTKNIALSYCNSTAVFTSNIFYPIFFLFKPIGKLFAYLSDFLLQPFNSKHTQTLDSKIKEIVLMLEDNGSHLEEVEIAQYFLGLRELQVQQVMIPIQDCVCVEWSNDINMFKNRMEGCLSQDFVIVWEQEMDNIIGIITVKDYLLFLYSHHTYTHGQFMNLLNKPRFILSTMTADQCLKWIKRDDTDILCVVNGLGAICGVIAFEDLAKRIFQYNNSDNIVIFPDKVLVLGNCNIRNINRTMKWHIPHDSMSIAGLIIHLTGGFPVANTKIFASDYEITVLDVNNNQSKQIIKTSIRQIRKNYDSIE